MIPLATLSPSVFEDCILMVIFCVCTEKLKDLYSWVAELSKRQTRERGAFKKADRRPPIRTPVLEDCKFKVKTLSWGHTSISQNSVPIKPLQCLWPLGQESLIKRVPGSCHLPCHVEYVESALFPF